MNEKVNYIAYGLYKTPNLIVGSIVCTSLKFIDIYKTIHGRYQSLVK